ncbi:unnamed protein product [Discosporangium mesarthrocarpum]
MDTPRPHRMDPERGAYMAEQLDEERLKDLTAADGTLPGGLTPKQLKDLVSNPELMQMMQSPKMQEIMKRVMADGTSGMDAFSSDPEAMKLIQKVSKALGDNI